jgi:hypothetical protein
MALQAWVSLYCCMTDQTSNAGQPTAQSPPASPVPNVVGNSGDEPSTMSCTAASGLFSIFLPPRLSFAGRFATLSRLKTKRYRVTGHIGSCTTRWKVFLFPDWVGFLLSILT